MPYSRSSHECALCMSVAWIGQVACKNSIVVIHMPTRLTFSGTLKDFYKERRLITD